MRVKQDLKGAKDSIKPLTPLTPLTSAVGNEPGTVPSTSTTIRSPIPVTSDLARTKMDVDNEPVCSPPRTTPASPGLTMAPLSIDSSLGCKFESRDSTGAGSSESKSEADQDSTLAGDSPVRNDIVNSSYGQGSLNKPSSMGPRDPTPGVVMLVRRQDSHPRSTMPAS